MDSLLGSFNSWLIDCDKCNFCHRYGRYAVNKMISQAISLSIEFSFFLICLGLQSRCSLMKFYCQAFEVNLFEIISFLPFLICASNQVFTWGKGLFFPLNPTWGNCFRRKRSDSALHNSNVDTKNSIKHSKGKVAASGKDISEPAVEPISLEMKQQELDGRYLLLSFNYDSNPS